MNAGFSETDMGMGSNQNVEVFKKNQPYGLSLSRAHPDDVNITGRRGVTLDAVADVGPNPRSW